MIFLFALWAVPAAVMSVWTGFAALMGATRPLGTSVPALATGHLLLVYRNPKDDILYHRPSVLMTLGLFMVGLVPLVNLVMLLAHLWLQVIVRRYAA